MMVTFSFCPVKPFFIQKKNIFFYESCIASHADEKMIRKSNQPFLGRVSKGLLAADLDRR